MNRPQTIQIFLPSGDPRGMRVAEITTRIVRVIEVPRSQLADFLKMPEAQQVGVYFLMGELSEAGLPRTYIGQSGSVGKRLEQHHQNKDFWNRAFVVISLTNSLTQTHALFLEWLAIAEATKAAGYPPKADPAKINKPLVVGILTLLVIYVTMVYGPIAAMLVELFPTRIRYTSMSLPYHIGNGWFGGLLPTIAFGMVAQSGNIYNGLWYPIIIASATFVIGMLFVKETKDTDIYADD